MIRKKKEKACPNLMKELTNISNFKNSQKNNHTQQITLIGYRFQFKRIKCF